jgi:hypothetical protein
VNARSALGSGPQEPELFAVTVWPPLFGGCHLSRNRARRVHHRPDRPVPLPQACTQGRRSCSAGHQQEHNGAHGKAGDMLGRGSRNASDLANSSRWNPSLQAARPDSPWLHASLPPASTRKLGGRRPPCAAGPKPGSPQGWLRVFLLGDAVGCAVAGQKVPDGYYHLDGMIESAARHGAEVG